MPLLFKLYVSEESLCTKELTKKGFTLIELMIVVAVIGVLAAVALPQYQKYIGKSEAASALATLSGLRTNIEAYTLEQGSFPDTETTPALKTRLGFPNAIIEAIEAEVESAVQAISFCHLIKSPTQVLRLVIINWH